MALKLTFVFDWVRCFLFRCFFCSFSSECYLRLFKTCLCVKEFWFSLLVSQLTINVQLLLSFSALYVTIGLIMDNLCCWFWCLLSYSFGHWCFQNENTVTVFWEVLIFSLGWLQVESMTFRTPGYLGLRNQSNSSSLVEGWVGLLAWFCWLNGSLYNRNWMENGTFRSAVENFTNSCPFKVETLILNKCFVCDGWKT